MSILNTFFVVMWATGMLFSLYLLVKGLGYLSHKRYQRGWKRITREWPSSQHRSYFTDCRRVPEDDSL